MASSIEESADEPSPADTLLYGERDSSLARRARFNEQPVDKSGWIEVCQSEPQVVTLTGVVTRGHMPGQQVKVQLEMTEDDFARFNEKHEKSSAKRRWVFDRRNGPHIFLMTILFMPISFISSLCISFYLGTLTWYNIIVFFSEEKSIVHKLTICPFVILTYPFTIGVSAFILALYSCIVQLSWFFNLWWQEVQDFEKGFYGWVCDKLHIPQCSPYDIVVLNECGEIQN